MRKVIVKASKQAVKGTTGKSTSKEYIKERLFDYACEMGLDFDGTPADKVVRQIEDLSPVFDVDDVFDTMDDNMMSITEAIDMLREDYESM